MEKILVIDDHAEIRDNISELLKLEGYVVYKAPDGESGIAKAKIGLPDLIICDINMPGFSGFEVLRELETNPLTSTIPFIFLTGSADIETRCKGRDIGADDYLLKPVCDNELIGAIKCRIKKGKILKSSLDQERATHVRELEDLIHSVSHGIRSPLCTLLGLINLLDHDKHISKQEIKLILSNIKSSALLFDNTTTELTQQLLAFLVKNKPNR